MSKSNSTPRRASCLSRGLLSLGTILVALIAAIALNFWVWKQTTTAQLQAGSQVARTAQGPVEYATTGQGPAVLVLHGALGGYDQGLLMAETLETQDFQFVAVSRGGYLRTPLETGRTPTEQAAAYVALLDELGIEKAAVIAASGGGFYALEFALRYPERCWGVVLLSANTQHPTETSASVSETPWGIFFRSMLTSDFAQWGFFSVARLSPATFIPALEQNPEWQARLLNDPQKLDWFMRLFASTQPPSLRLPGAMNDGEQLRSFAPYPTPANPPPALVIHGTADLVPLADAEHVLQYIPTAQIIWVQDGDHWNMITHQAELAPQIVEFLKRYAH